MKEQVHYEFWKRFPSMIEEILKSSDFESVWKIEPFDLEKLSSYYQYFGIIPKHDQMGLGNTLGVFIAQSRSSDDYRLYYGVRWHPVPSELETEGLRNLSNELASMGVSSIANSWPGWKWIDYRLRGRRFIVRMKNEPDKLVKEVADVYWKFFLHINPFVLEALKEE